MKVHCIACELDGAVEEYKIVLMRKEGDIGQWRCPKCGIGVYVEKEKRYTNGEWLDLVHRYWLDAIDIVNEDPRRVPLREWMKDFETLERYDEEDEK